MLKKNKDDEVRNYLQNHIHLINKLEPITIQADITGKKRTNTNLAYKIADLFYAYAHPPFFSVCWHHKANRELADRIARHIYNDSNQSAEYYIKCLNDMVNKSNNINSLGTFASVASEAKRLLNTEISQGNNFSKHQNKKV